MIYQRDMKLFSFAWNWLGKEAEQEPDDSRENRIDAEEEDRKEAGHDQHHDRGRHGFLARRPVNLGGFGADLADEFPGGDFGHVLDSL